MPIIRPHLSASQLNTYLACGVRWERQYIRAERSPSNGYLVRGLALDDACNLHYRAKAKGGDGLDAGDFVEAALSQHSARLEEGGVELEVSEAESKSMLRSAAIGYYREVATKLRPRSVQDIQRKFTVSLDDVDIVGYVDLILESGAVVDHKLKTSVPSAAALAADVQLSTYAMFTGATNLALAIAQPTGKAGIYWTQRGPEDVERVKRLYSRVFAAISLGMVLPAAPGSWNCSPKWCPFHSKCSWGGADVDS